MSVSASTSTWNPTSTGTAPGVFGKRTVPFWPPPARRTWRRRTSNRDGYADLLFANNNSEHQSLVLYRGRARRVFRHPAKQWKPGDAIGVTLADVTGDRNPDLIVAHKDDRGDDSQGHRAGESPVRPGSRFPSLGAEDSRVGDLNRDGHPRPDSAQRAEARCPIFTGEERMATPPGRRQELPTLAATDAVLADYNGDGWVDLAFSNNHDGETRDVASYLYWNGPRGVPRCLPPGTPELRSREPSPPATWTGTGTRIWPSSTRTAGPSDAIDSVVYWGNPRHHYSPRRGEHHSRQGRFGDDGRPEPRRLGRSDLSRRLHLRRRLRWLPVGGRSWRWSGPTESRSAI